METVEVVIRIPKEQYEYICHGQKTFTTELCLLNGVCDSILLPKGHGRLIDEAEILKFLRCPKYENCDWKNCSDCNESRCINFNNVKSLASIIEADKVDE